MNNLPIIIGLTLSVLICHSTLQSMKRSESLNVCFTHFSLLSPEIQHKIFSYHSKADVQLINKAWSYDASITSARAFDNDLAGLHKEHITRIIINAAYVGNYEGVNNILKRSSLLGCSKQGNKCEKDHILYYAIDYRNERKIIDFYDIAYSHVETKWKELLKKYRIVKVPDLPAVETDFLTMSCLAGNSYIINTIADHKNAPNAFYVSIACGHSLCVKKIIDNLYRDSCWGDFSINTKNARLLLTFSSLQYACLKKNIKIIEEILQTKEIDVNEIQATMVPTTLLDQMIGLAQNDWEYNDVVLLLQKYDAKTIQEIDERAEEEKEIILNVVSCVIS